MPKIEPWTSYVQSMCLTMPPCPPPPSNDHLDRGETFNRLLWSISIVLKWGGGSSVEWYVCPWPCCYFQIQVWKKNLYSTLKETLSGTLSFVGRVSIPSFHCSSPKLHTMCSGGLENLLKRIGGGGLQHEGKKNTEMGSSSFLQNQKVPSTHTTQGLCRIILIIVKSYCCPT